MWVALVVFYKLNKLRTKERQSLNVPKTCVKLFILIFFLHIYLFSVKNTFCSSTAVAASSSNTRRQPHRVVFNGQNGILIQFVSYIEFALSWINLSSVGRLLFVAVSHGEMWALSASTRITASTRSVVATRETLFRYIAAKETKIKKVPRIMISSRSSVLFHSRLVVLLRSSFSFANLMEIKHDWIGAAEVVENEPFSTQHQEHRRLPLCYCFASPSF